MTLYGLGAGGGGGGGGANRYRHRALGAGTWWGSAHSMWKGEKWLTAGSTVLPISDVGKTVRKDQKVHFWAHYTSDGDGKVQSESRVRRWPGSSSGRRSTVRGWLGKGGSRRSGLGQHGLTEARRASLRSVVSWLVLLRSQRWELKSIFWIWQERYACCAQKPPEI